MGIEIKNANHVPREKMKDAMLFLFESEARDSIAEVWVQSDEDWMEIKRNDGSRAVVNYSFGRL